jgi:predicted RNA binding protein YcfA (HicA-like mRNA interferase family)
MRITDLTTVYKIAEMKVKEIIKIIEQNGWFMVRIKGSHRQYKHNTKKGVVTIAGNLNDELAKGTRNSILNQAGLKHGRQKSA